MKIAIFTNNYLPNPYGVPNSIETFRRDFEKLGHQVYIFAPNWPGYVDENPNVFRYPSWDIEIKIRFPLAIPFSRKIDRILAKLDIDIIHSQHPNLLGKPAMKWARKKKIPLIFTWHTLYDQYANFVPFIPSSIAGWYMISGAVRYANKSDMVVAPTDSIIPKLRGWGVDNEIVAQHTGVVEEDFHDADGKSVRRKYGVSDDETLLLFVSRLTKEKNVDFLFRSVARVLEKNRKVKFLAAAGGYMMDELKKFVLDKKLDSQVIFAGHVENYIRKNYFAAADIFVFASKSETQGMVFSEAAYMGLPIVAVDATGSKSMVLNNGNGFLVSEDEEEFSGAVDKLVDDKDLRKKFSETSKKIAAEKYVSSVCAENMLAIYEQAIADII